VEEEGVWLGLRLRFWLRFSFGFGIGFGFGSEREKTHGNYACNTVTLLFAGVAETVAVAIVVVVVAIAFVIVAILAALAVTVSTTLDTPKGSAPALARRTFTNVELRQLIRLFFGSVFPDGGDYRSRGLSSWQLSTQFQPNWNSHRYTSRLSFSFSQQMLQTHCSHGQLL